MRCKELCKLFVLGVATAVLLVLPTGCRSAEKQIERVMETTDTLYQICKSENGKYVIYSKADRFAATDVYFYNVQAEKETRLTENDADIEYSLAVSNSGNYAFAQHDRTESASAYPKLMFNGREVEDSRNELYYRNLVFSGETLLYTGDRLTDGESVVFLLDNTAEEPESIETDLAVNQLVLDPKDKSAVYASGYTISGGKYVIAKVSFTEHTCDYLYQSDHILKINSVLDGVVFFDEISGNEEGIYLLLALSELYGSQSREAISVGNNYNGRLSWYVGPRIGGLIDLYEKTGLDEASEQVRLCVSNVLSSVNGKNGIDGPINQPYLWSTKVYGVDLSQLDCMLVNQACVLLGLLEAAEADLVTEEQHAEILDIAEKMYDYYETDYYGNGEYRFRYGRNGQFDGLCLPFNQQNVWGSCLCKMYELTGEHRYAERAKELAEYFKKEFVYLDDGRLVWHYWPQKFYDGWAESDDVSSHTPQRAAQIDLLYEDVSHAGCNFKFILTYVDTFGMDVFDADDLNAIRQTIETFIDEDGLCSRYIGNDRESASRFRYISPYWSAGGGPHFLEYTAQWKRYYQEHDQELLGLYAERLKEPNTATLNVNVSVLKDGAVTANAWEYDYSDILNYAAEKWSVWNN